VNKPSVVYARSVNFMIYLSYFVGKKIWWYRQCYANYMIIQFNNNGIHGLSCWLCLELVIGYLVQSYVISVSNSSELLLIYCPKLP
jgi:hypothetical protein